MVAFDAGMITSDAGALLLRATDRAIKMMSGLHRAFTMCGVWIDRARGRDPGRERVFGSRLDMRT